LNETRDQVTRLTKLATDLLDLSRLDAGQLRVERQEVDLADAARTVAEEFRAVADAGEHSLSVSADEPVNAVADEQRVAQIARILVENALRHTPSGTPVEITATELDGHALLSVRDEGMGIRDEEQERLFTRFYRPGGGVASGSGLGLAIATELARLMEGAIELRSRPGESVFTLSLPLHEAISRENEPEPAATTL
jgi:signal transduction histidine kinase